MYMLAAGLVMPPEGFGDKYYRDTLGDFPGWIPLFIDKVPREAIESSTSETGHLRPCIVEFGLSQMSGRAMAIVEGGLRALHFPDQLTGTERAILVPAPLPTAWIVSIVFQSIDDKRVCEADAGDFGNVPLADFKRRTAKPLFTKASNMPWPPESGPPERAIPLQGALAAGGVMAMLVQFGNLGEQAVRACRHAFDPNDDSGPTATEHPILAGLRTWVREGVAAIPAPGDAGTDRADLQDKSQAMLFWEAVDRLAAWRDDPRTGSAEDALIDSLDAASARLDARLRAGVGKLHDTLVSLTGLPDATTGELFERHDTPLAHAMTLFLLRRDCADLVDFRNDRLGETDWLAAAILFGVRDGWLNLPLRLRAHPGLAAAVSTAWPGSLIESPARESSSASLRRGCAPCASSSGTAPRGDPARNPRRSCSPERRNGTAFTPGSDSVRVNTSSRWRAARSASIFLASPMFPPRSTCSDFCTRWPRSVWTSRPKGRSAGCSGPE